MSAETEATVYCDGPREPTFACPYMNSETGPTIGEVRAFLKNIGWAKRTRAGETVDLCPICKEA